MSDRTFFDTNVLVYAFDLADDARYSIAWRLLDRALTDRTAVFSFQVLQEFYVVSTRRIRRPLTLPQARGIVADLTRHPVVEPTTAHLVQAIDLSMRHRLSYWDALILVTAAVGGCDVIYTEDLGHGDTIAGVRIVNPFK